MVQSFRVVVVLLVGGWLLGTAPVEGAPAASSPPANGTLTLQALPDGADAADAPGRSAPATPAPGALGLPSLTGPIGLFGTSTAEVGPVHQLRVGLHAEYFSSSDFLVVGDSDQRLRGELAVGFTPHRRLEIFGALLTSSNRNDRVRSTTDLDPELVKSYGDLVLGAKGIYPLSPGATVGFELGLKFLAGVSELSFSPSSTSLWLGPVFTYDLRQTAQSLPLRVHASLSYYLDNSSNLRDLSGVSSNTKEATMFGYGIAPSRLRVAVAADVPLGREVLPVPLDPFLEYHFEYATTDADSTFAAYTPPACGTASSLHSCVDNRDSHFVTLGLRAAVFRGLTADLGVDLRLRSPGYPYGTPVPPYNVVFGLSLPVDLDSIVQPRVVTRTVEAPPRRGYVTGAVRSADGAAPVPGAVVVVARHPHVNAATDEAGAFTTVELEPGPVSLQVSAPGFEPAQVAVSVVAGQAAAVTVALAAKPPSATVHGRALGRDGHGLGATIKLAGQGKTEGIFETHGDANGAYSLSLPVGAYRVRAEATGLPAQETQLDLVANQDKALDFVWRPAGGAPNVALGEGSIRLSQPIRFVGASAKLTPDAQRVLDGVAALLVAHPEVRAVEVVAHWDTSLSPEAAEALTKQQAEAVRGYLLARGITGERLAAQGAGSSQPLVPADNPASRVKNRRVELHVK